MSLYRTIFFKIILVLLLCLPAYGVGESYYTYAIRYGFQKAWLDQIDLTKDEVVRSMVVDPRYNSASFLDKNYLVLCNTGGQLSLGGADLFSLTKGKKHKAFKLKNSTPTLAVPLSQQIIFLTTKRRHVNIGSKTKKDIRIRWNRTFEFVSCPDMQWLGSIDLEVDHDILESVSLSHDKSKLFYITDRVIQNHGRLGIIDLETRQVVRQIDTKQYFGAGEWVAAGPKDRLYVTAVYASPEEGQKSEAERRLNDKLFVFDAEDLSFIKKIPIGVLAEQLTYVPAVNRLYIAHSSLSEQTPQYVEVLDCDKDKVVAKISVEGFRRMSYVGNNKLYISCSGGPLLGSNGESGILVVDVRTNKIIKKISGEYAPISYNFNL